MQFQRAQLVRLSSERKSHDVTDDRSRDLINIVADTLTTSLHLRT